MSRSSPAVHRTAAILNFFAAHTGQAFTLTDVAKSTKISRATCHTLLTGLVEVGYLHRLQGKSYVLGPVLVSLANTVSARHSPLQVAQPEMRALADQFDGVCIAAFREGHDVVLRERAASVSHCGWSVPAGTRLPLLAPYAAIFFARSPKTEADAWLARLTPAASAELRAQTFEGMLFAREYGFSFGTYVQELRGRELQNDWMQRGDAEDAPVVLRTGLDPGRSYQLAFVSAPVFDAQQRIAFELVLTGLTGEVSGAEVAQIAERVQEACERIRGFVASSAAAA
jgi:DNA-binding IclR family transcriptional regulator